jgi:hypothetical protein
MRWILKTLLWLKGAAPYAWIPALIVSGVSAYFAYQNFALQVAANHPELVFTHVALNDPYDQGILDLQMRNVGVAIQRFGGRHDLGPERPVHA